jgi:hypothetical protein
MNLADPYALVWLALAVPLVAFYLLMVRPRSERVPTLLFWQRVFQETQAVTLWRRLRQLLSLLLQLALLLLLVGALAEPVLDRQVRDARRLVLVIDNSAGMNATDVPPDRLSRAREKARELVAGLRYHDEMAVVTAGSRPQVLCGLTGHAGTLRAAIDAVPATDGPTRVADAVALARRLFAGHPNGRALVVTDGCFAEAPQLAAAPDAALVLVGERTGNVGITRFQVRRSLLDPTGYEVLTEVTNQADEAVSCRLELELAGSLIDVVPLELKANERWQHVFEKTATAGGRLVARLDRPDALAADNEARALLPDRAPQKVLLVTGPNVYLEKVFEANPLVALTVTAVLPTAVPPGTVTVFHRQVPERLPAGPVLVIDPAGPCDLFALGEPLRNPLLARQDRDSPLLANVKLDTAVLPEARKVVPRGAVRALVATEAGDPIYFAADRPDGKALVLATNLEAGDLPLRTAFPILVSNALAWFAGERADLQEALSAGALAAVDLPGPGGPAEGSSWWLRDPAGRLRRLAVHGARALAGPLDQCGVWGVVAGPPGGEPAAGAVPYREIACNLAGGSESDLRPPEGIAPAAEAGGAGLLGRPLWLYLLLAVWLLAGLEWVLYQRRRIE